MGHDERPSTSPIINDDLTDTERVVKIAVVGDGPEKPIVWVCVTASLSTGEITCRMQKCA